MHTSLLASSHPSGLQLAASFSTPYTTEPSLREGIRYHEKFETIFLITSLVNQPKDWSLVIVSTGYVLMKNFLKRNSNLPAPWYQVQVSPGDSMVGFHVNDAVDCPEWVVPFHVFKALAEEYDLELVFAKNSHEFVHEYLKRPEYVDLMRRLGALGDGNQDKNMENTPRKTVCGSTNQKTRKDEGGWSSTLSSGPRRITQRSTANSITGRSAAAPVAANDEEDETMAEKTENHGGLRHRVVYGNISWNKSNNQGLKRLEKSAMATKAATTQEQRPPQPSTPVSTVTSYVSVAAWWIKEYQRECTISLQVIYHTCHVMGETHAQGGGQTLGGENPLGGGQALGGGQVLGGGEVLVGGPQQMALMFEMIKGMQQNQVELAESLRQLREANGNKEDHQNKNDNRNHEERESHNKNDTPFVTMSNPYPEKYDTPVFALFDGRKGSAMEHISKFLDSMGPFAAHGDLCLREFSKSLVDRASTWYTVLLAGSIRTWEDIVESFCSKYFHVEEKITLVNLHGTKQQIGEDLVKYIHRFRDVSLDCHVKYQEGELVEVCIDNMLPEFRAHLENLDITRFAPLLQKARKTAISVKPQVEKGRDKKSLPQTLTVSTATTPSGTKRKNSTEKKSLPQQVPSLVPAAVRTLQKSPKFKSLFNQLGFGPEARNAATEALITIATESGATCFTAEAHASRAFLETTNVITFTDEDMEVQYPDHRRPLYLSAVVKDVQVRRALVDTGSCLNLIPLSTLQAANVSQQKIQGSPMEVTGFGGVTEYTMGHVQLVLRVGPIVALTRFHCGECGSSLPCAPRERLNGKPIRIVANFCPFDQTEAHFIEATLYDDLASTGEPSIVRPCRTPLPAWENIKDDPEIDLRELFERKKKGKEREVEHGSPPQCDKDLEKKKEAAAGPRAKLAAEKGKKKEKNELEKKAGSSWTYRQAAAEKGKQKKERKKKGTTQSELELQREKWLGFLRVLGVFLLLDSTASFPSYRNQGVLCPTNPCGSTLGLLRNYYFATTCTWVCNLKVVAEPMAMNSKKVAEDQIESTVMSLGGFPVDHARFMVMNFEEEDMVNQTESTTMRKEKSTTTEPNMTSKEELEMCLLGNYDEMPGIDPGLVAHYLNVEPGTRPVVQPMRTFHTEVEAQITQEVKKLLAAGFIKPIQHPRWLSNIVPVKKKNRQIRCCVDFRNLNKACPKDEFPLPNMDLLIDSATGHAMFSFMDGFSGYNQIRMSTKDAEKTAFRTPIGNFYYTVMPFGLKNADATYQRIMTAMFHDMMHKEIEDYVDDIVVKSKKREDHLGILRKVFDRCRLYKLKMNPLKCAFRVSAGKFLGFLVHNREIDVDPAKASTIATMKAPTSHKELKSFLGRLSYIRRFIPGLAAVTVVFAPLMKKGVPFVWSTACQQAFEKIQAIMTKLPTVCAPVPGRPLRLYLASNSEAIGGLVAQEDEDGTERPIYYVSRALRDAEIRYSGAERACLALIYASQRLRDYFLAHKIQLMTKSHPIRSLLHRPVLSGQAIADILTQFPGEDNSSISHEVPGGMGEALLADLVDSTWTLKFDGSSTSNSSGAGIVLIREDGETIAKSFKIDFSCSNNASEYEAYITGLVITHEMGIKHLRVIRDSNLIICQTKGEFSLKEPSLALYRALAQKLEKKFDTFEISHVMRCENRYADALATLGSQVSFEGSKVDVTIDKRSMPITDLLREKFKEQNLDTEDWQMPIKAKLMSPEGVADLKVLKDYVLIAGDLYCRLPGEVLARCVNLQKAAKKLIEVHEKCCEFRDEQRGQGMAGMHERQLVGGRKAAPSTPLGPFHTPISL
uniref:Uncharacterized protein n=1 Tax=Fagus sylvatica TaxID=28930 RepID=A0A2N9HKP8_FAGSY